MIISKEKVASTKCEQVAAILGISSNLVQVTEGIDNIEVKVRDSVNSENWGEVPAKEMDAVMKWAGTVLS